MSFTLSTIKNPYLSLTKDKLINLNTGGVEDISLQLNLNAPHTLDLTINPNLGNLYYEFLENANMGIYLSQDDGLKLTFVKKPQDTKSEQSVFSKAKISFLSTVSLLKNTRVYPRQMPIGSVFTGTTDIYFSSISDKIHISFISKPLNEKISTNVGDCWDLFTDGVDKLGGYSWRDLGVYNGKIHLEVGNSKDRNQQTDLVAIAPMEGVVKDNVIFIRDLNFFESGEVLSHLRPIGNTGSGGDLSTMLLITSKYLQYIKIKDNFPLVASTETMFNGEILYDVYNNSYTGDFEKGEVYVVETASDVQDTQTKEITNQVQTLYNKAVAFLKTKNQNIRYELTLELRKIILPGTKIKVFYAFKQSDGKVIQLNDIYTMGDIGYSLEDFKKFI